MNLPSTLLAVLFISASLVGCASLARNGENDRDPFEPLNRRTFAFNNAVDRAVIEPVARAYRAAVPEFVRDRIRSIIDNLEEPLIFVNNLLQLRIDAAGTTFGRFVTNSTAGLGGMFDRATPDGLPRQSGDFGQTLHRWGAEAGPYLVLPLLGPSNVRDAIGIGIDSYIDPVALIGSPRNQRIFRITSAVVGGVDLRERNIEALEELEKNALDLYVLLRSIVRQRRAVVLNEARKSDEVEELVDPAPAR